MSALKPPSGPDAPRHVLRRARVPRCLLGAPVPGAALDADDAALLDLTIGDGRITAITPAANASPDLPFVDLDGRHLWPGLIDMHTHLDKGHIIPRAANPDGTFAGARDATMADRIKHWSHEDVTRRMRFGLRCAYAHGVAAIRTHLDSHEGQADISWAAFREMRSEWADRIPLQAVALMPIDGYRGAYGLHLADLVARSGGILGGVTRVAGGLHGQPVEDLDALLDRIFILAIERGLDVDLHVDESGDPSAASLPRVAAAALRNRFAGKLVCGHCCSLAVQPEEEVRRTLALCAEAGITIVTLPTVNMYLQDRVPDRTPRWRGVTLVRELRAAGVPVAIAGDNCRDPFHAYGDHDMVDTFRQGVKILHLDHPLGDAPALVGPEPARAMGIGPLGSISVGGPARLILFNARTMNQLLSRPQSDRAVIDGGRWVDAVAPDYEELEG